MNQFTYEITFCPIVAMLLLEVNIKWSWLYLRMNQIAFAQKRGHLRWPPDYIFAVDTFGTVIIVSLTTFTLTAMKSFSMMDLIIV